MREILFRGKRTDNGEWIESCNVFLDGKKKHIYIPNPDTDMRAKAYLCYEVIPQTVGQYTGLTDKNGTKVFEGDIVDILTENEEIGVVNYEDGGFLVDADGFCVDFHANINGKDVEVIGNIHDNPELVEG